MTPQKLCTQLRVYSELLELAVSEGSIFKEVLFIEKCKLILLQLEEGMQNGLLP